MQKYEINIILMKIREKIFFKAFIAAMLIFGINGSAKAQIDVKQDTIECHIIGFNIGLRMPSSHISIGTAPDGSVSTDATMSALYKSPWMDYGVNCIYKYKSNWLVSYDMNLWFGNDNLRNRVERMGSVFSRDSIVIGSNGTDATVTCFNRGFGLMGGVGKIFTVDPEKNPNSGILARLNAGYMRQQTIFMINYEHAPQIDGDYANLYDHQRHGLMLSQSVGYWYMSTRANLVNLYVELGVSECWSRSTRDYTIDNVLGLHGPDQNRYFDLMYTLKFSWMFPLKGKTAHDYYFY